MININVITGLKERKFLYLNLNNTLITSHSKPKLPLFCNCEAPYSARIFVWVVTRHYIFEICRSLVNLSVDLDDVMTSPPRFNMYGKCGSLEDARYVFDNIQNGNVIHWTCMIAVYVQRGRVTQALEIFSKMHEKGLNPNNVTLVNVFKCVF